MISSVMRRAIIFCSLVCLLAPSSAWARGFILITHGQTVSDRGEVPAALVTSFEASTAAGVRVGYCYNHFGLFFVDLWTWDGRPCLHTEATIWELSPRLEAGLAHADPALIDKPLLYRFPLGLLIVVVGGGLLFVIGLFVQRADKRRADALLASDGKYRDALESLRLDPTGAQATELLVERGVPPKEAMEVIDLFQNVFFDGGPEPEDEAPASGS